MILAITENAAAQANGDPNAPLRLSPASFEAVAAARALAAPTKSPVAAVVFSPDANAPENALGALGALGLDRIYRAHHPALAAYDPEIWVQSLVQVVSRVQPDYVVLAHTYQARDFAPQLATRMGAGLISDVTAIAFTEPPPDSPARPLFIRPMFQGKLAAEVAFTHSGLGFVTVQLGAFPSAQQAAQPAAEPAAATPVPTPIEDIAVTPAASRLKSEPVFKEARHAVDLSQAPIIVAAGRGIKESKNLELIRQLAEALGGELAASRPICDAGWLPMDRQVGSSGQTVTPRLYLAVGISGAIQHLVGMKGSRTIVAINKDPEAPIFEVADFGVVGDLFQVVPALIAALNKTSGTP